MPEAEAIVRKYLAYLDDPSVLRDDEAIADVRRRAEETSDVVERLKLLSEAERLQDPSADDLHEAFVKEVKGWAKAEGVTAGALMKVGVPPGVLRDAGFTIGGQGRASKRSGRRSGGGGRRGPGVSVEAVRAAVPASGTFTVKDLREASGASPGTVRKAMAEMLEDGTIVDRGEDPTWEGPGRVPTLYEKT